VDAMSTASRRQGGKVMFYLLTTKGLGYILGDIFTNSSGHPGCGRETRHLVPPFNTGRFPAKQAQMDKFF
jgi:hypothetical protein